MTAPSETPTPWSTRDHIIWMLCVAFAVVPLLLFLALLQIGAPSLFLSDVPFQEELRGGAKARLHLANGLLEYVIFLFVHALICLAVGGYFLVRMWAYGQRWVTSVFSVIFAIVVSVAVVQMCLQNSAFREYMILPVQEVLLRAAVEQLVFPVFARADVFVVALLVLPTLLGVSVVVLASGGHHARILFSKAAIKPRDPEEAGTLSPEFKSDLMALSAVLVSSTLTARVYFHLNSTLFVDPEKGFGSVFGALSGTLSTGAGLLFSATLIAAFMPGLVIVTAATSAGVRGEGRVARLGLNLAGNLGRVLSKFREVWQVVLAFAAPAVASPLMDMIVGVLG